MISNNAKWIWINKENEKNQYVDFLSKFNVDKINKTTLSLSVAGDYAIYLNGTFIHSARFDDYVEFKYYDEIDITSYLKQGENELWVIGYTMYGGTGRSTTMEPGYILEIADDNNSIIFSTNTSNTKCRLSKIYKSGKDVLTIGNGNAYSADVNLVNVDYDDFEASVLSKGEYTLLLRPCKKTVNTGILPAVLQAQGVFKVDDSIEKRSIKLHQAWLSHRLVKDMTNKNTRYSFPQQDGVNFDGKNENIYLLFDLKEEQNGYIAFDFDIEEDCDVEIAFGEHLDDLRVRSSIDGRNFTSVFHAKKGNNKFTDYMHRLGLRYIQVFFYTSKVNLRYFSMVYNMYPVTVYPYETDNALRKKIYNASVKTLRECMHEHYEDCPWREQALYAMDSRNQMLCGYYTFKEFEFPRANLELLFKRRRPNNQLLLTAPTDCWLNIPCFTLVSFLSLREYTDYSKDITLADSVKDVLHEIIETFISQIDPKKNLLQRYPDNDECIWNFYEWIEGMWNNWGDHPLAKGSVEYPVILNAFFVVALTNYSTILSYLGIDSTRYLKIAEEIKEAITKTFWNDEKQCFAAYETDGELSYYTELANSMVVYCGAGTDKQREIVGKKLMSKDSGLSEVTLSMSIYKYQALIDQDIKNVDYVLNEIDDKWGKMVYNNASTVWETIVGADDFDFAGSLCHGWSAIPAYFYMKYANKNK